MSTPAVVMILIVFLVGLPAAIKNVTAAGLFLSWSIQEVGWLLTHENPTLLKLLCDYLVLLVIFLKADARDCSPYPNLWAQFIALWRERWWGDRIVIALFGLMWLLYSLPISEYHRWWGLWGLTAFQFFVAGGEALWRWRAQRRARNDKSLPPRVLRAALGYV